MYTMNCYAVTTYTITKFYFSTLTLDQKIFRERTIYLSEIATEHHTITIS